MNSPYCTTCRHFYQDFGGPVKISDGCDRVWEEEDMDSNDNIILNSYGKCPGYSPKELNEKDKERFELRDVYSVHGRYIDGCRLFFTAECMMDWLKEYLSAHDKRNHELRIYFNMDSVMLKGYDERTGHFDEIKESE